MKKLIIILLILVCIFLVDLALGQPIPASGAWLFRVLLDTPNTYTDQALKGLRVNSGETAIEFYAFADSIGLGTDTTGNYVKSITNGTGITGGDSGSEGAALTIVATLGTDITGSEIRDADYGDFTFSSGSATLNADVVGGDEILDADYGDFTFSSGSATINADAVALATDTTGNYVATIADAGNSAITVANSGSENAAVTLDIAANGVEMATDTTGNYVATVADGTGIDGTASGEGATYTPTFDATELTALTWSAGGSASITHTFDGSGSADTSMQYGDGYIIASGTINATALQEGGNAVWNASETDIIDSGHYIAASIDYEHLADDVVSGAAAVGAFESGDTFLVLEAGVGLREANYDDLPGAAGGDSWGDPVDAHIIPTGSDDTYDVGSSTNQFRNGYFDGTLEADILTEGGNAVPNATDHLGFFGGTTSAELAGEISDETGTGLVVFSTDPIFTDKVVVKKLSDTSGQSPLLFFERGRDGDPTDDISSGDELGNIYFRGYHTSGFDYGAQIRAVSEDTPGENDMPAKLQFLTSDDGSNLPTLRMTLDSTGNTELGADNNTGNLIIHSGGTLTMYDPSDDTLFSASVQDGTTVLVASGTINATGLQVGGVAVLTSAANVLDFTEFVDLMTLDASTTIRTDDKTLIIQASSTQTNDIFVIEKSDGTDLFRVESSGTIDLIHTSTANDDHTLELITDAAGFGDIKSLDIDYITGAISAGEDEGIILINIDEILATGGEIFGLEVLSTEGSADVYGLKVGATVGPVHQDSGTFANPTTGTDNTISTDVAAMIDGATATTTTIFENDNEYILIGAAAVFQEIEIILTTGASGGGIAPTFGYSISGSHTYTTFAPVDGTNGFRNTGIIAWDASDLTSHVANDETTTFDIIITRTKNSLSTDPVLGYAKVASTIEYVWDKDGDVNIKDLTMSGTINGAAIVTSGTDPDVDAVGEIGRDTDDHSLRGYSAQTGQFLYAQATKTIQFTIAQPDDLDETDDIPVWTNKSGFTFHIRSIEGFCDAASATFTLVTASPTNFTAETTIESITLNLAGTGMYYDTIAYADIDHTTISNGDVIIYDPTTFDAKWIKVTLIGFFDSDVN